MKSIFFASAFILLFGQLIGQKGQSSLATNLNSSRSNVYRIVYPAQILTAPNAQSLLVELEKAKPADQTGIENWLVANFHRFDVKADQVRQISFYSALPTGDCKACRKRCKGVCGVIGNSSDNECYCIDIRFRTTQNLSEAAADKSITIILLSADKVDDVTSLQRISTTLTTSRSNSN